MTDARRNLLLIGAGGFVGPWLARAALGGGWSVTGLSRRVTANYGPAYEHVAGDAVEPSAYRPSLDRADAIIYNAAHIPANFTDPAEAEACLRVNAQGLLLVLRLLVERPRPLVYISGAQGYCVTGRLATEADLLFPTGHAAYYLGSKLLGDLYAEHYRLVHQVPAAVLRLGSVYGPNQQRGMVSHFVRQARLQQPITLKSGGRYSVDLTFVADAADAMLQVLARRSTGIFNIGSGRPTSALAAARIVLAATGRSEEMLRIEPAQAGMAADGFAALDISRASRELAFVPTQPDAGLRRTVLEWST